MYRIEESGSLQYDSDGSHDGSRRIEKEIVKEDPRDGEDLLF